MRKEAKKSFHSLYILANESPSKSSEFHHEDAKTLCYKKTKTQTARILEYLAIEWSKTMKNTADLLKILQSFLPYKVNKEIN